LTTLVDERLLTSYEVDEGTGPASRRVEIIHESLLANWPRLVGWQTQDADAARVRDELRQAARTWDERGRPAGRLWTGATFREFLAWRERYPGRLSEVEEAFAAAMSSHARRRRRGRVTAAAAAAVLLLGLALVFAVLWRSSVAERVRADSQQLVSLGRVELDTFPTAAVAHATASLRVRDDPSARFLALEALWRGPLALVASEEASFWPRFTADGEWFVEPSSITPTIRVFGADGSSDVAEGSAAGKGYNVILMAAAAPNFVSRGNLAGETRISFWSAPERRLLASRSYPPGTRGVGIHIAPDGSRGFFTYLEGSSLLTDVFYTDGRHQRLGSVDVGILPPGGGLPAGLTFGPKEALLLLKNGEPFISDLDDNGFTAPRRLSIHEDSAVRAAAVDPHSGLLATLDESGKIRVWDTAMRPAAATILAESGDERLEFPLFALDGTLLFANTVSAPRDRFFVWRLADGEIDFAGSVQLPDSDNVEAAAGRFLAKSGADGKTRVWDLEASPAAEPRVFARPGSSFPGHPSISPGGRWLTTAGADGLMFWPLHPSPGPFPTVLAGHRDQVNGVAVGPGGEWVASSSHDGTVRRWPLRSESPATPEILFDRDAFLYEMSASGDGDRILVGTGYDPWLITLSTGETSRLSLLGRNQAKSWTSLSPDGRLAAASAGLPSTNEGTVQVKDLDTGRTISELEPGGDRTSTLNAFAFLGNEEVLTSDGGKLYRKSLEGGVTNVVAEVGRVALIVTSRDGRRAGIIDANPQSRTTGTAAIVDLDTGEVRKLPTHGGRVLTMALGPEGRVVATGDEDGIIRVGPVGPDEPHLLLGHDGSIGDLEFDPTGEWIVSGGFDGTVRIWPLPDLSSPPLHTLPREQLIAKLESLTNVRVVRDAESETGWKLTRDPFPGWRTVPTW
ncbi:MAG: hypothetical protein R3190_05195, partial [Thermoanaerobaculia bacterium]|nr:hypothetical protein [Thermoanaerobaculia bacterium]